MPHDKTVESIALIIYSSLNRVITEALKNRISRQNPWSYYNWRQLLFTLMHFHPGRLRPDFLARCKWDVSRHVCTGYVWRSFFTEPLLIQRRRHLPNP